MKKVLSLLTAFGLAFGGWVAPAMSAPLSITADTNIVDNTTDADEDGLDYDGNGDWVVTVTDGVNLNTNANAAGVVTAGNGAANGGTLTLSGSHTVNGTVGAVGNALEAVNYGANGATVTINDDLFATTVTITGTGTVNSDHIGGAIVFAGDGVLSMDTGENVDGAITVSTTNTGTLTHEGTTTNTGQVGSASAVLKEINAGANGATSTFSADVFTTLMDVTGTGAVALNGNFGSSAFTSGVLDFEADGTVTIADNMSLFGSVTNGTGGDAGNLTFSGTSTVSGQVGAAGVASVNVITLNGAGETVTFQSNVFADDLVQGAANTLSIGANTVTLLDDLVMDAAGTLAITVNSASAFGNIQVTGDTTMAATNTIDVNVDGALANGATLAVITSATGVAAAPTVTDNSAFLSFTATEPTAGDVVLTATTNTAGVGTTANSSEVLTAVNSALASGTSGDMTTVLNSLYSISDASAATSALETMDPTGNNGAAQTSFLVGSQQMAAVTGHLGEVRSGMNAGGATGVSTGETWYDTGMWVKGYGSMIDQDNRGGFNGYDADTWGVTGGLDGLIADDVRLGFAGGYGNSEVENKGEAGGTDIDTYQGTVYVAFEGQPLYVNTAFTFGWNSYDSTRNISFAGVNRTALSDTDGQQYTVLVDGGYVIKHEQWEITPLASLEYSHLNIDGYTETGAGALNLTVDDQSYDFLQLGLGGKLALPIKDDNGTWVPEVHARWLYDFIGDEFQATARFAGGGSSFTTRGLEPAQSALNAGAGLTFFSLGNVSLSATYDFTYKEDFNSHYGEAVLRYNF